MSRLSHLSFFLPPHARSTNKSFKPLSQASLAQRMCSGAERASVNQLSLYTSPSLPNITLGLPATATATAASSVRQSAALRSVRPRAPRICALNPFPPLSSPGDLSADGRQPAASALPQPAVPLRQPPDPLPGRGGGRNGWAPCTQPAASAHGADGAKSSTEPPGDR